jgi:group 4 capsule polysaccharide lipoprotein GfcB/YjbF
MHKFLCVLLCLFQAACSQNQSMPHLWQLFKQSIVGSSQDNISRDHASKLPYASLAAKISDSGSVMMVLGYVDGKRLYWYSHSKQILITKNNQIIRSLNFPKNLEYLKGNTQLFEQNLFYLKKPITEQRLMDFDLRSLVNLSVTATLTPEATEEISLYGLKYQTRRIKEKVYIPFINRHYVNYYWVAEDGYIWKSIQHIHPDLAPLTIEILKRPAIKRGTA